MTRPKVLLCRCAIHNCLSADEVSAVEKQLEGIDSIDLLVVDDLCAATMQKEGPDLRADHVIGCHPRALRWLLAKDDPTTALADDALHDLKAHDAETLVKQLQKNLHGNGQTGTSTRKTAEGDARGWFPVLDYDRCTHCAQCVSFCLFDVFATTDDHKVTVAVPENCKDNCPACARICPEVAIMFPKVDDSPINGDTIQDELMEREKARIALEQTGTDSLRATLKERRRGSLLKPEARQRIAGDDAED